MRQLMCLCLAVLFLNAPGYGVNAARAVDEPDLELDPAADVDFSILPPDVEKLRDLDTRHRQLIERTIRQCTGRRGGISGEDLSQNPCVVRGVERLLGDAANSRLTAFHYALPEDVRHDHTRTEMEWQPAVTSRIARTQPLWDE